MGEGPCLSLVLVMVTIIVMVGQTWATSRTLVQTNTTRGASGVKCTSAGSHCLWGMRCVAKKCICPDGQKGNADFECVDSKANLCLLKGESRLTSYGGSGINVLLPCTFRATRFVVQKGQRFGATCSVEVHVTNEMKLDLFRPRAVHVSVGITDSVLQLHRTAETLVTGSYGKDNFKIYNYEIRSSPVDAFMYGSQFSEAEEQSQVNPIQATVDEVNNFVVLDIPECDTRIKYRSYDPRKAAQTLSPGVSISIPEKAQFVAGSRAASHFPYSMCGQPADGPRMFKARGTTRGFSGGGSAAIIGDILEQNSRQIDNPMGKQCQNAEKLFSSSRDQKADMNACSFVLTKKLLKRCLVISEIEPMDVFVACLTQRQRPLHKSSCSTLSQAVAKCGSRWTGNKKYCNN